MCAHIMFARAFVLIRETTSINVRPDGRSALSGREMCASVMFAGAFRAARVDPLSKNVNETFATATFMPAEAVWGNQTLHPQ